MRSPSGRVPCPMIETSSNDAGASQASGTTDTA